MNKAFKILMIAISFAGSMLSLIFTSYAWLGVFDALPLLFFAARKAFVAGLLIGLFTSFSLYLSYPLSKVAQLSMLLGSLAGLPPFLAFSLYPLLFSFLTAFSASMWSEIYSSIKYLLNKNAWGRNHG